MTLGCSQSVSEAYDLVILNAQIIDLQNASVAKDQWIGINGDRIAAIGKMSSVPATEGAQVLDAKGAYAMPGLWDNHVHFRGGDTLVAENKNLIPLLLAYGITTVRDAGGDITHAVKEWQQLISEGSMIGPSIFTSGPKLDGPKPAWAGSIALADPEEVSKALDSLESIGVDYIKIYDGSLSKEVFYQIVRQSEARGLKVTGHMPLTADLMDAVDLGLDGTEHMYYVLKACSPLRDSLTALNLGYGMMNALVDSYDPQLANSVFQIMAEKEVFVTPTLYIGGVLSGLATENHLGDSLYGLIGKGIHQTYEGRIKSAKRNTSSLSKSRGKLGEHFKSMILPMADAGVPILAGSDCGPYNSFVYPGASLHGELQALVEAGLSTRQALIASVVTGPQFVGKADDYGALTVGKIADILLLNSNPLDDIRNTQSMQALVKRGKIHTKEELMNALNEIGELYAEN